VVKPCPRTVLCFRMRLFPLTLFWSIIECQWILCIMVPKARYLHTSEITLQIGSRWTISDMSGKSPVWTSFLHRLPSGFHGFPQSTRAGILSWIRTLILLIDFTISRHRCIIWVKCQRRKYGHRNFFLIISKTNWRSCDFTVWKLPLGSSAWSQGSEILCGKTWKNMGLPLR